MVLNVSTLAITLSSQISEKLRQAKEKVPILRGGVRIVKEFRRDGSRRVECKRRGRKHYEVTEARR